MPIDIPLELRVNVELVKAITTRFIRAEIHRIGLTRAVLGLSGGIDSAVVCWLACLALGPENVVPILMPASSSSADSVDDAMELVRFLQIPRYHRISVSPQVETYFEKSEVPQSADDAEMKNRIGNKMARERMTILYDFSVVEKALVLGTSNKTELLLGYGTLHGDMASALNPIGDLYKMQIYQLAEHAGLPQALISKAPSADLWAGQTDEGQLGFTYRDVDRLPLRLVDLRLDPTELMAQGFDETFIKRVSWLIRSSQYKRRPPLICKLSERTIDRDFNYARDWGS